MAAEGLQADIQNAQGDEQKFSTLADGMISSGVKVLVIASITSDGGAAVEAKAKAQGIPVIDYDRLDLGGTADYYVSFDNVKVGELQGQGLVQGIGSKPGAQVIQIEGAPTDNNATLFYNGQQNVLKPLFDSGTLKLVPEAGHPELGQPAGRHDVRADPHVQRRQGRRRGRGQRRPRGRDHHRAAEVRPQRQGPGHRPGRHPGRPAGDPARRPVHDGLQADQAGGRLDRQARGRAGQGRHRRRRRASPRRRRRTRRATGRSSRCCSPRS